MNGGDILVETLVRNGVDTAFTVPGESFLSVLEALRRQRNRIRLITSRHEGGGGFAAEAFGKLTGRPAALFVSRGPGATNAAIAVHTARQDSTPLLLFVGQVRTHTRGREAFQEIDQAAMFAPVAKAVLEPATTAEIAAVTAEAIAIARAGRPGPVVVVLPRDLTEAESDGTAIDVVAPPARVADRERLHAAAAAITAAERPLVIAGEMIATEPAHGALAAFASAAAAPVLAAYRRQDVIDNRDPAYAGHLEINRVAYQRQLLAEADLLIAAGSRLDGITAEEGALVAERPLLMLYPERAVLDRFATQLTLETDLAPALEALATLLPPAPAERRRWCAAQHEAYLAFSEPGNVAVAGEVDLAAVVAEVQRQVPGDAIILSDGGSFARWVHRYVRFRYPHSQAGPVSGAMGYAVPGAIGARLAWPDRTVVAFVGDGSFMMTGQELATAVEQQLAFIVVVCDNAAHGSILQGQLNAYGSDHVYGTRLTSPDFAALARSYGAAAWTVARTADFADCLRAARAVSGPALIHLKTDERDIVPYGVGREAV